MKAILIVAALLMLAACAGSGTKIDVSQLSEMRKGQTTITEVVRKFGKPNLLSKNWDGTQTAAYATADSGSAASALPVVGAVVSGGSAGAESVIFYFDDKGVLTDYKLPRTTTAVSTQASTQTAPAAQSNTPAAISQGAATMTPGTVKPAPASPARKREDGLPSWLPSDSKDVRY